jgi:hypothetical protein
MQIDIAISHTYLLCCNKQLFLTLSNKTEEKGKGRGALPKVISSRAAYYTKTWHSITYRFFSPPSFST